MSTQLTEIIDQKLGGALGRMAQQDARTPALQLLWLAQREAIKRGMLTNVEQPHRERIHNPQKPHARAMPEGAP